MSDPNEVTAESLMATFGKLDGGKLIANRVTISRQDLFDIHTALGLLNSMVLSGEEHTDASEDLLKKARAALSRLESLA